MADFPTPALRGYEDVGGHPALDLVNTIGWRGSDHEHDLLETAAHLVTLADWLRLPDAGAPDMAAALEGDPAGAEAGLARIRSTREALYRVFHPLAMGGEPSDSDLADVTRRYGTAVRTAQPTLSPTGVGWQWHDLAPWDQLVNHVLVASVELLDAGVVQRIKRCGEDTCGWLFVDKSKNGSRRWCSMEICGSRTKMRRHYQRRKHADAAR